MLKILTIAAVTALAMPAVASSGGAQPRPAPSPSAPAGPPLGPAPKPPDLAPATQERERVTKAQEQQQERWNAAASRNIKSMCRGCTGPSGRKTPMFLGNVDPL